MDFEVTSGITVYRLVAHAYDHLGIAGAPVPFQILGWQSPVTLALLPPTETGEYVLVLSGLKSREGAGLDGLYPGGVSEGLHRRDDDGLNAPAPYRSLKWVRGEPERDFLTWPSFPYLKVTEITALYTRGGSGLRDQNPEVLFDHTQGRVAALPPRNDLVTLRIRFASPAGFPYSLPSPESLRHEIKILKEDGSEIPTRLDLSADPAMEWVRTPPPTVEAVTGMIVTASSGPGQPLGNFRSPAEEVYLLLGNAPPPSGILARIRAYDPARFQYTVTVPPLHTSGVITGNIFYSHTLLPEGFIGPGSVLWAGGVSHPVVSASARRVILKEDPPALQGHCDGCFFQWVDLTSRVQPGTPIFFTSTIWYLHPRFPPFPSLVPLYLVIGDGGSIRNLMGAPFRDEERDGDEGLSPPMPEDRFVLKLAFRPTQEQVLTATRVNDGRFYPTVAEALRIPCVGDPALPICIRRVPDPFCQGKEVEAILGFSFTTADGDSDRPFGYSDLVNLDSLTPSLIRLEDRGGRPLAREIHTRTVFPETPYGIFPTTFVEVILREQNQEGCSRSFSRDDRLILDHRLRFLVPQEPSTLDGNGDGVASPDPEDDWIGLYDPDAHTFTPLARFPRRPP